MPQYYNLSKYSESDNIMGIYSATDTLMQGYFSLFLILVLGVWITYIRIQKDDSTLNAIITGSFYSLMLAIVLYASNVYYSGITSPGLYIFVPTIILVGCAVVKFYNKQ
jgi:ribonuclease PH